MALAAVKLTDDQFKALRDVVYQRSGIWFADNKRYVLESRLARRLQELELDDFGQYVTLLSMGPYREDEFQEMFNRITINETSFFRNAPQLDVFEKKFLPKLLEARKTTRRLRIWSAACSTGEEPYTLAIQIHRTLGIRMADWHVEILGSDISERVLMTAQTGRYTDYSVRSMDSMITRRYFTQDGSMYQLDPTIMSMVNFERINLKDAYAAKRHGVFDVIFCRNVIIYFDQKMRDGCLKLFHDMLSDDGVLMIGHSETIREPHLYSPVAETQAFAYTKAKRSV
ncbi:protein-glutamate O-methyltransferase CheR [Planctomycetales bacterium ZRK34]|nr:protein-glutamate O-methyltransferase CheR [Planctomycetales bacterium ZRK34]